MVVKIGRLEVRKPVSRKLVCMLIMLSCSVFNNLYSQNSGTKPTRQSAVEAFAKGDYEKAYRDFRELLLVYPKDPLYKYYTGTCLVKLNRNAAEAESVLTEAMKTSSGVKSLPADVRFYLGRAQQMSGKYREAVASFNLFTEEAGKKAAKDLNVQEYIKQCNDKKGKTDDAQVAEEKVIARPAAEIKTEEKKPDPVVPVKESVVKDSVRKMIPESYDKILDEALSLQNKADSMYSIAAGQKKKLEKAAAAEKSSIKSTITETENSAASYQKAADQKYSEAQVAMNPNRENKVHDSSDVIIKKPVINQDTVVKKSKTETVNVTKLQEGSQAKIIDNKDIKGAKPSEVVKKQTEIFSVFEVLPKPVADPKEKIEIDPDVPPGLIYRIQIAVFRNPVSPAYFKGISPVYGFKMSGTDKTIYYAGMFRKSVDASAALTKVKAVGFKDAFIVALANKKTVSADRAAVLEKETGNKPFTVISDTSTETAVDTVPPTLAFRVEVTRSVKPLKDDVIQGITKMAGSRGLDIQAVDDGKLAYLIGKFITFESAAEYSDLLIRNGYRDAKVVAWLGKKEVPVDTAKKLFEDIK